MFQGKFYLLFTAWRYCSADTVASHSGCLDGVRTPFGTLSLNETKFKRLYQRWKTETNLKHFWWGINLTIVWLFVHTNINFTSWDKVLRASDTINKWRLLKVGCHKKVIKCTESRWRWMGPSTRRLWLVHCVKPKLTLLRLFVVTEQCLWHEGILLWFLTLVT